VPADPQARLWPNRERVTRPDPPQSPGRLAPSRRLPPQALALHVGRLGRARTPVPPGPVLPAAA
jgi:hypothetical protein